MFGNHLELQDQDQVVGHPELEALPQKLLHQQKRPNPPEGKLILIEITSPDLFAPELNDQA